MKIGLITPAPPGSRYGNRVTALRWARILRKLGHRVTITQEYDGVSYGMLIALHARRSYASINRFHKEHTGKPLIVALTGTDLYRDLRKDGRAQKSLEMATCIIALQPRALDELPPRLRDKTRIIYQSVAMGNHSVDESISSDSDFKVCVIGHLRHVKDPFRAAMAARLLTPESHIKVIQVGGAMTEGMSVRARAEMKKNPRYRWLGEQPKSKVHRILAKSRVCVLSSRMEGGANVLSEAIVAGVPVLASRIPGTTGILGEDYPGYFDVGDTRELARLLIRAETQAEFLAELKARVDGLASLFDPAREEASWSDLLDEVC